MVEKNIVGNVVTVGGIKACNRCQRPFRFLSINGKTPLLVEAADGNGLGLRVVEHDCSQTDESIKALRSTIGHSKQIIGRSFPCTYCHAGCRRVYSFSSDIWTWINDPGLTAEELMQYAGPLVEHNCQERADAA